MISAFLSTVYESLNGFGVHFTIRVILHRAITADEREMLQEYLLDSLNATLSQTIKLSVCEFSLWRNSVHQGDVISPFIFSVSVIRPHNELVFRMCVCEFGFNVAFNNFSVISRRCLVATGSSMLTFIVLPH